MKTLKAYIELTKPRITLLVVLTTWLGFALASGRPGWFWFHTVLGTWLAAAGAAALNQYLERAQDAVMRRTQSRPLPQHRLTPDQAFSFGVALCVLGLFELLFEVNALTAALGAITLASYLLLYTPLKQTTPLSTLVGAVPGALPPMMGWTAAKGSIAPEAWLLFSILYLWQLPHFLAIAWIYREDYARAGFPMLPVLDPEGGSTARMIILYSTVLLPVTLLPARLGLAGVSYFWGALGLGMLFWGCGAGAALYRTPVYAKRLLLASVIYLPVLLTWMVCNRVA